MRSSTVSVPSSPVSMRSSDSHAHKTISKLFMTVDLASEEAVNLTSIPAKPKTAAAAIVVTPTIKQSAPVILPLTPPMTPLSPRRPARARRQMTLSPVTPSRAPAKALKLLGAAGPPPPMPKKQKDRFRPLPKSTLLEVERFFGATTTSQYRKASPSAAAKKVKDEEIFAWLLNDPSTNREGRTDMGRYISDEEDTAWMPMPPAKGSKVKESFVDLFGESKPKKKAQPKKKKSARGDLAPTATATAPHPWSAAALALDSMTVPTLSYSSTESGPSSPDSEVTLTPPRRPKKRPPPLVLDLKPKGNLPIVILNSPATRTPVRSRAEQVVVRPITTLTMHTATETAQTPFVHPRRAPKPKPRALDLAKAALPRMTDTDTRMPLLPPIQLQHRHHQRLTPDEELPISVFEPVTPTDAYHPGDKRERGGWLKKVVKDFGHMKI